MPNWASAIGSGAVRDACAGPLPREAAQWLSVLREREATTSGYGAGRRASRIRPTPFILSLAHDRGSFDREPLVTLCRAHHFERDLLEFRRLVKHRRRCPDLPCRLPGSERPGHARHDDSTHDFTNCHLGTPRQSTRPTEKKGASTPHSTSLPGRGGEGTLRHNRVETERQPLARRRSPNGDTTRESDACDGRRSWCRRCDARRCGEMADAQDLKSWDRKKSCRFESDHRHQNQPWVQQ